MYDEITFLAAISTLNWFRGPLLCLRATALWDACNSHAVQKPASLQGPGDCYFTPPRLRPSMRPAARNCETYGRPLNARILWLRSWEPNRVGRGATFVCDRLVWRSRWLPSPCPHQATDTTNEAVNHPWYSFRRQQLNLTQTGDHPERNRRARWAAGVLSLQLFKQ
ncbi:uncharacterized protein BCR38DRAFT_88304 [Pseudomassariella vexata]|uniref:Uncharacterized protein n=1 Tax=Pseudomassariella vexata TaxID=1141098 RepID=A0A1Y2EDD1_9PEZI|nr:uncharacterized protein BCR38DRAFT_88304 [Pseudomassariella vexata]ORY69570.1 hypothetical protein BCR38DRAFT_88304 [Pseudomassariella vexata]